MKLFPVVTMLLFTLASSALAQSPQEPLTAAKGVELKKSDKPEGWVRSATLSLGGNLVENENVVGQTDGKTTSYTLKLSGSANHVTANTEWENRLDLSETYSRSPTIDRFVKSADQLDLSSFYKYFFESTPWLGAFAKVTVSTNAMPSYDERAAETNYSVCDKDGVCESESGERLKLAGSLAPLTTKESLGVIAKVYESQPATIEIRTGPAAKQISARDALLVADVKETEDVVEVFELQNVTMSGAEIGIELKGKDETGKVEYKAYGEALYPVTYSPESDSDPSRQKLTSTEVGVAATFNLLDWLGLNYTFKSKREPLFLEKAQVTHNFMLTMALKVGDDVK